MMVENETAIQSDYQGTEMKWSLSVGVFGNLLDVIQSDFWFQASVQSWFSIQNLFSEKYSGYCVQAPVCQNIHLCFKSTKLKSEI